MASLQAATRDVPVEDITLTVGADGKLSQTLPMNSNDVVLASLTPQP